MKLKEVLKGKVVKAGIGYTFANLLLSGIGVITVPIFTRLLTTEDYGLYNIYLSYTSIIYIFISLALHSSIKNAKYEYDEKFNDYISSISLLIIFNAAIFIITANIFCSKIEKLTGLNRSVINLLLLQSLGSGIIYIYSSKISLNYKYKKFMLISVINTLGNVLLSLILMIYIFPSSRYLGRILGNAVPVLLISFSVLFSFYKIEKPKINLQYWKFGLKYSLPIIPHGLSQVLLLQLDRIMIKQYWNSEMVGLYSFSYTIGSIFSLVANSLETVWSPWFYEKMNNKDYKILRKRSSQYLILLSIIAGSLILIAPEFTEVLAPKTYWESKYSTTPVILGLFFSVIYTMPAQIEYFLKQTKFIAIGTVSSAIINVVLNSLFIPKYGYIGAAYATLISYFLYFIFHYFIAKKLLGFNLFDIKVFGFVIFVIFVVSIINMMFINNIIIRGMMLLIIILFSLFMLKNYLKEEKLD